MHFYENSLWILQKKKKRKLKCYAKRDFVNHKFHFNFPHKFPRMFCQFLSIYVCIYTQFQPMSLIDLNFSAGKVKTKQNKRKMRMRIYLIFYLYRDVEAPPRIDTDISLGDVKCVLDRQSSNPCHAPLFPPHLTHLVTVTTTKNKKILCQFPWADDGGHQSPQYTTVYIVYI